MWKLICNDYPTLALIAQDILAIPVLEVGVEWLFNKGQDLCHY
jgi:hypothetical protein